MRDVKIISIINIRIKADLGNTAETGQLLCACALFQFQICLLNKQMIFKSAR